jgi:hypothetical protein
MRLISNFFQKNERWLTPVVLLGGFIIDNLTLRRADLLLENALLTFYLLCLMGAILLWHKLQSREQKSVRINEIESILFLTIQFIFGNLFSGLTVFYIKSASIFASWPFLIVLFAGMISTEYFKKHFSRFLIQLTTLYLLLFTYLIVVVPLFVRAINAFVFIVSGVLSLVLIFLYLKLFKKVVPNLIKNKTNKIVAAISGVFLIMNIFYFLNIIPPIPLALRDTGVYKSVVRTDTGYVFAYFDSKFSFKNLKTEYSVPAGSYVYFYSSVFAPVKFEQIIMHEWQKKDSKGDWIKMSSVTFPIFGGSDTGYRGYTVSAQVTKGEWRVLVKTKGGQVLGGKNFVVR